MAQEPRYQKVQENSQFLVNPERLIEISKANTEQGGQVKQFLELYSKTAEWKKFKEGFLSMNYIFKPEDVIQFQFCPSSNTSIASFYPKKKKIYICQNYMSDQNMFNSFVNYNMTLLYDFLRSDVDFKSCPQVLCMNIRATNISSFCKPGDKRCFQNYLKRQLRGFKPCENQFDEQFNKAFQQCLLDMAPIHSIKSRIN